MNQKSARIIATYFGLGLSKIAPGTMGSLGTLPLAYALIYFGGFWALMAAAAVLFVRKPLLKKAGTAILPKLSLTKRSGSCFLFPLWPIWRRNI